MRDTGRNPVKIRCCQYLNNVVEQDHCRVKGRLRPMLEFKTFYNTRYCNRRSQGPGSGAEAVARSNTAR